MSAADGSPGTPVYPGSRLGLPESGRGAVASWLARVAALLVDWFASLAVASLVFGSGVFGSGPEQFATLGIFVLEAGVLTALAGGSFGQVVLRLAVVRLAPDGSRRPVGLLVALGREILVALVIPPLVFNRDNRGLHDIVFGTVVVRR